MIITYKFIGNTILLSPRIKKKNLLSPINVATDICTERIIVLRQKKCHAILKSGIFRLKHNVLYFEGGGVVLVFNATFNNISVISLLSVLLLKETRVKGENQ